MNFKRIIETIKSYDLKTINYRLIIYVLTLSVIGILAISSATDVKETYYKQILGVGVGFVAMMIFAMIKYDFIARYYWLLYLATIILLVLVLTPAGESHMGAQRWLSVLGIQMQPSEFAKLFLIIFFSSIITKNRQSLNSWKFVIALIILAAIPVFLVFKEPDLSSSIVLFVIICAIIFTSELKGRFIRILLAVAVPVAGILLTLIIILPADNNIIKEYQYNRLIGFYDEDNEDAEKLRYQQENSVLAIANGSLTGKGLKNNSVTSVKNAEYLSEPETDFIFTIIGEELGFVGSCGTIALLLLIIIACFRMGMRAREGIGRGICIGMGTLIGFQSFVNLGVATMVLPNTGLTLPFVSAGLSSLIVLYMSIGIVLNVGIRRKIAFQV